MHKIYKIAWVCRALVFSLMLGSYKMPGYLGRTTFIYGGRQIFIQRRVRIFPGLRAEAHGAGQIHIHENVTIEQDFHITAIGDLHVGSGCKILANVMVTDIDHEYRDTTRPVAEQPRVFSETRIGENCFIGMGARIQAGTILGRGCVVGANAVVRGEFPAHSVIVGAPGRIVKRYDPESDTWLRT
jgi:acetyltransferase-like isoleucine patch superfamily enzyme